MSSVIPPPQKSHFSLFVVHAATCHPSFHEQSKSLCRVLVSPGSGSRSWEATRDTISLTDNGTPSVKMVSQVSWCNLPPAATSPRDPRYNVTRPLSSVRKMLLKRMSTKSTPSSESSSVLLTVDTTKRMSSSIFAVFVDYPNMFAYPFKETEFHREVEHIISTFVFVVISTCAICHK